VLAGFSTAASAMVMVIEYACCDASRVYRSTVRDGNRELSGAGDVGEAVLVGRNVDEAHGRRDRPSERLTPTSRGRRSPQGSSDHTTVSKNIFAILTKLLYIESQSTKLCQTTALRMDHRKNPAGSGLSGVLMNGRRPLLNARNSEAVDLYDGWQPGLAV
jgi:hypothetical protein